MISDARFFKTLFLLKGKSDFEYNLKYKMVTNHCRKISLSVKTNIWNNLNSEHM